MPDKACQSPFPRIPYTAFTLFCIDERLKAKQALIDRNVMLPTIPELLGPMLAEECKVRWFRLSEEEQEHYITRYNTSIVEYKKELIRIEDDERKALERGEGRDDDNNGNNGKEEEEEEEEEEAAAEAAAAAAVEKEEEEEEEANGEDTGEDIEAGVKRRKVMETGEDQPSLSFSSSSSSSSSSNAPSPSLSLSPSSSPLATKADKLKKKTGKKRKVVGDSASNPSLPSPEADGKVKKKKGKKKNGGGETGDSSLSPAGPSNSPKKKKEKIKGSEQNIGDLTPSANTAETDVNVKAKEQRVEGGDAGSISTSPSGADDVDTKKKKRRKKKKKNANSSPASIPTGPPAQRTLVVVPGSHRRKDCLDLVLAAGAAMKKDNVAECAVMNKWSSPAITLRAFEMNILNDCVQLDIRPPDSERNDRSRLVLWNSRTIYCNYSSARQVPSKYRAKSGSGSSSSSSSSSGNDDKAGKKEIEWDIAKGKLPPYMIHKPQLHRPPTFHVTSEEKEWRAYLEEEGYVVLRGLMTIEEVDEAVDNLREDLRLLNCQRDSELMLDHVDECEKDSSSGEYRGHLTNFFGNGIRWSRGIPHGRFAWQLRNNGLVRRAFELLHGTKDLSGSVDATHLSPSMTRDRGVFNPKSDRGSLWLQSGVNPSSSSAFKDAKMWQSVLHVYPQCGADGYRWEQMGQSICYAPTSQRPPEAKRTFLAMCISGDPSTHWPQLAKKHNSGRDVGQGKKRYGHLTRIPCSLAPGLTDGMVATLCNGKKRVKAVKTVRKLRELTLGDLRHSELRDEELQQLIKPDYLSHILGSPTTNST